MPDATDLAATLRRRSDEVMAEARERAGQGETVHDSIVGLWAVEDVQPIATALERGAAAEAAIAAFRVWRLNQHSVQGWMSNGRLEVSMLTAMAAYDALTEGKSTDG